MFFVLTLMCGADPTFAVVNKVPPAFVVVNRCPAAKSAPLPRIVPVGMHAHVRTDGSTIVHSDLNNNVPGAHAGLVMNRFGKYIRTAEAGQRVPGTYPEIPDSSVCPPGGCPTSVPTYTPLATRWRLFR